MQLHQALGISAVSTHSRLKAAGFKIACNVTVWLVSTHSRLKAAGLAELYLPAAISRFQHTAA